MSIELDTPKPRPDAWAMTCYNPDHGIITVACREQVPPDDGVVCPVCGCDGWFESNPPVMALWGSDWAMVARMAEQEKRMAVAYDHLEEVGRMIEEESCLYWEIGEHENLADDVMHLLCVNI